MVPTTMVDKADYRVGNQPMRASKVKELAYRFSSLTAASSNNWEKSESQGKLSGPSRTEVPANAVEDRFAPQRPSSVNSGVSCTMSAASVRSVSSSTLLHRSHCFIKQRKKEGKDPFRPRTVCVFVRINTMSGKIPLSHM
jgi:hypothetical protein